MNLNSFKEQMMGGEPQTQLDSPTELYATLIALVSGGQLAPMSPGGGGNFANASWSKAM